MEKRIPRAEAPCIRFNKRKQKKEVAVLLLGGSKVYKDKAFSQEVLTCS